MQLLLVRGKIYGLLMHELLLWATCPNGHLQIPWMHSLPVTLHMLPRSHSEPIRSANGVNGAFKVVSF